MAAVSFMITDNTNGVMTTSFSLTESEIKRIADALKVIYAAQFTEKATDSEAFECLAHNLMEYICKTCQETEINQKIEEYKKQTVDIQPINRG